MPCTRTSSDPNQITPRPFFSAAVIMPKMSAELFAAQGMLSPAGRALRFDFGSSSPFSGLDSAGRFLRERVDMVEYFYKESRVKKGATSEMEAAAGKA
jgi:hypothetical protein